MVIYVLMGWVALVSLVPLLQALGSAGFGWLAAGGAFYTIGILFFALDTRLAHARGVWHLFVIAGSISHYVAILDFVLRGSTGRAGARRLSGKHSLLRETRKSTDSARGETQRMNTRNPKRMVKRARKTPWSRSVQRTLVALARTAIRVGSKALVRPLRNALSMPKRSLRKHKPLPAPEWRAGVTIGRAGLRRYWLFNPAGVRSTEDLPLLVMLHGCRQDAELLAASTQMNQVAVRERFFVLYPEQDRFSNLQACWNWYETRSGRAQSEADAINATIDRICQQEPVDADRIAVAGFSAGAGMAAFLATRDPERFQAVAMHCGIAPGVANSSATALNAMRGRRVTAAPLPQLLAGTHLPALLVIHGSADRVVAPSNGAEAVRLWAATESATASAPRTVQDGTRYAATVTDYRCGDRLVATLFEVNGLGHAWSGGAAGQAFSDPEGPDASSAIWAFASKQFAAGRRSRDRKTRV